MLIIPAEHPLDWKRPPVITLLLILLNTLIYFGYQGGDEERREQAVQAYLDSGLLSRERPLFVDDLVRRDQLEADERDYVDGMRRQDLASAILHDLQFEQRLHQNPEYQADPAWQQARGRAEALRGLGLEVDEAPLLAAAHGRIIGTDQHISQVLDHPRDEACIARVRGNRARYRMVLENPKESGR